MSEFVSACVSWLVDTQRVRELIAFVEINNRASRRILLKHGMVIKRCSSSSWYVRSTLSGSFTGNSHWDLSDSAQVLTGIFPCGT